MRVILNQGKNSRIWVSVTAKSLSVDIWRFHGRMETTFALSLHTVKEKQAYK